MHFFRDLYTELSFLVFYPWRRETNVSDDVQKTSPHKINDTFSRKTFIANLVLLLLMQAHETFSLRRMVPLKPFRVPSGVTYNQ